MTMSKKTLRINKTKNNLQNVWEHLDDASGSLYNALEQLERMTGLGDESNLKSIRSMIQRVDVGLIDTLKEEVETLIIQKEND